MKWIKYVFFAVGTLILLTFMVLRFADDVVMHVKSAAELSEGNLSWFAPIERSDLTSARDFKLETDIDTNDFLISFRFDSQAAALLFMEKLKKKGFTHSRISCMQLPSLCSKLGSSSEMSIDQFKLQSTPDEFEHQNFVWVDLKTSTSILSNDPREYGIENF